MLYLNCWCFDCLLIIPDLFSNWIPFLPHPDMHIPFYWEMLSPSRNERTTTLCFAKKNDPFWPFFYCQLVFLCLSFPLRFPPAKRINWWSALFAFCKTPEEKSYCKTPPKQIMTNYLHLALVGSARLRVAVAHLPTVSTTVPAMNSYMHSTGQLSIS